MTDHTIIGHMGGQQISREIALLILILIEIDALVNEVLRKLGYITIEMP